MRKTIEMLNVREDAKVKIVVVDNLVTVEGKDGKRLFFKLVPFDKNINDLVADLINRHFEKDFAIMNMDIF